MNKYYFDFKDLNAMNAGERVVLNHTNILDYEIKKRQTGRLQFVIRAHRNEVFLEDFTERIKDIIKNLTDEQISLNDISVVVDNNLNYTYTNDEWKKIEDINQIFEKENISFGFDDVFNTFSIEQVRTANKKIESTANKLRDNNFSPYEKLMAAYLKVSSKKYVSEKDNEDPAMSRSVYGVLNSNNVVCIGYANWLKAIIDAVGDENIKVYPNFVQCAKDNNTFDDMHANVVVYVKDEKYGIDGYYYCDPTWDCAQEDDTSKKLSFFMLPLEDVKKLPIRIRGINVSLVGNTNSSMGAKPKRKLFNEKDPEAISFSEDGILPCPNFLADLLKRYPTLIKEIPNAYCNYVLQHKYNLKITDANNTIKILNDYVDLFNSNGVRYLTKMDLVDFRFVLEDSLRTKDFNKLKSVANSLIAKYSTKETNVKQTLNALYNKVDTYCNDEIERLKRLIELSKKTMMEIEQKTNPSKNEKRLLQITPIYIKKYNDKLLRQEKSAGFIDELKALFEDNPKLKDIYCGLNNFKQLDNRIISLLNNSQTSQEFVNSVKKSLMIEGEESVIECLVENANSISDNVAKEKSEMDYEVRNILNGKSGAEQIINGKYICEITNALVCKSIIKNSKPVEIAKTQCALKNIISKLHPNLTTAQVESETQKIISFSVNRSKSVFKPNAINTLFNENIIDEKIIK